MNSCSGFILSIVLMLNHLDMPEPGNQNCESMRLQVEVMPATDQGSTIKLRVPQDADLKVVLMRDDPPGQPNEVMVVDSELRHVAPGSYDIVVVDKKHKYCSEVQKVKVN